MNTDIWIVIDEKDVDPAVIATAKAVGDGDRVLGGEDATRTVMDALPRAIAKRVLKIVPEGFGLVEMELSVKVGGTILGIGVAGDVKLKLAPLKAKQ